LRCYGEYLPGGLDACCFEGVGGFATAINSLEVVKHLSYDVQEDRERRHPMKHNRKAGSFSTTTAKADIYAFFFDQKGLMAGLGLQGSKITKLNK
jgi:hypothetical protein